jgi:hypothetical protein
MRKTLILNSLRLNMKKRVLALAFLIFTISVVIPVSAEISVITGDVISKGPTDLGVSSFLLKAVVEEGESLSKPITISSTDGGRFSVEVIGVSGVKVSEDIFSLENNEKKDISVEFNSKGLDPGVFIGSVEITGEGEIRVIPVSFSVESEDLFFDLNLNIPPGYSVIEPGGKLVANVKIFDLTGFQSSGSLGQSSVDLEYTVTSIDGSLLMSESESVIVDGQTDFSKTITFPEDVSEGDFFITATVKYGSSVGTASDLFTIGEIEKASPTPDFDLNLGAVLIVVVIGFAGFIFMFVFFIRDRNNMLSQLRRHNTSERKDQIKLLLAQKKVLRKKGRRRRDLNREIKRKVYNLKIRQKRRKAEFKRLKKRKKIGTMQNKLNEWKRQGYHSGDKDYKLKNLSSNDMSHLLRNWKSKGYSL